VIAGALGALVLGLTLSYVFLVVRDQPLINGADAYGPSLPSAEPGPPGSADHAMAYRDGATLYLELWLANNGRFGLTVTGVDTHRRGGVISVTDVRVPAVDAQATGVREEIPPRETRPFAPFHLDVGKSRPIVLQLRLDHCEDVAVGLDSRVSVTVHYDVLGNGHTMSVPSERSGPVVRYGRSSECPRPPTSTPMLASPPPTR
jgi:hypothetical protein